MSYKAKTPATATATVATTAESSREAAPSALGGADSGAAGASLIIGASAMGASVLGAGGDDTSASGDEAGLLELDPEGEDGGVELLELDGVLLEEGEVGGEDDFGAGEDDDDDDEGVGAVAEPEPDDFGDCAGELFPGELVLFGDEDEDDGDFDGLLLGEVELAIPPAMATKRRKSITIWFWYDIFF